MHRSRYIYIYKFNFITSLYSKCSFKTFDSFTIVIVSSGIQVLFLTTVILKLQIEHTLFTCVYKDDPFYWSYYPTQLIELITDTILIHLLHYTDRYVLILLFVYKIITLYE